MPILSNRRFDEHTAAKAKVKDKPYELRDGKETGLILRIQPSGTKIWYCALRDGRRHRVGSATKISLTEARRAVQYARATNTAPVALEDLQPKQEPPSVPTLFEFIQGRYKEHYLEQHPKDKERAERKRMSRYADVNADLDYVGGLNNFAALREFDRIPLDQFDRDMIDRWVTRRLKIVAKATVRRNVGALQTALNRAVEWKILKANPLVGPAFVKKADEPRTRSLSPEEEKRMRKALKHSQPYFQQMVLLAINTGMRRGELLKLCWSDVDLKRRMLTVRADIAKSEKARHIPLNDEAFAVLNAIEPKESERTVILYRDSSVSNITGAWNKLATRAELEDATFHCLRHTFASKLVLRKVPLYTVQKLMGHSDPKLTARYSHLDADHLRDAVGVL